MPKCSFVGIQTSIENFVILDIVVPTNENSGSLGNPYCFWFIQGPEVALWIGLTRLTGVAVAVLHYCGGVWQSLEGRLEQIAEICWL